MLGLWELSVGMLLLISQASGAMDGVAILLGLMSFYKIGVAVLLYCIGRGDTAGKIIGNVRTAGVLLLWA